MESNNDDLTYWERVTARAALFRYKKRCERDVARQEERGWKPEPGAVDIPRERLKHIESLLTKITDPDGD